MAFAASNRVQLAYAPETTFGTIPGVLSGYPRALRTTGESLKFALTKENDKEINPTAQLTSSTTTGAQADGDIKVHVQYAEYDNLLAGVCRSAWNAYGTNGSGKTGGTFSATMAVNSVTAGAAPTLTNAFTNLQRGQWFILYLPNAATNSPVNLLRVSTSVDPTGTVITLDPSTPLKVETSVAGAYISTARLTNGVTLQSFAIEKQMQDVGQFHTFRGMNVSKFSTSFASKALTEGTFTFLGKDMLAGNATQLVGAVAASNTYDIQNGVRGLGNLWVDGAPLLSTSIKSVTMDIDSALRAQDAAGTLGLVGVGIGTFKVSGKLTVYFATGALYAKFLADQYTSLVISTQDTAGNGYVISLPKIMLTTGQVLAGGKDTDMMAEFDYVAYADKTNPVTALQKTIFIDRVGDAVVL